MKITRLHSWHITLQEAQALQKQLVEKLAFPSIDLDAIRYIAGIDVSYAKGDTHLYAAIVVLEYPSLKLVEKASGSDQPLFPYIPGFLAFRELPLLCNLFESLTITPDLVMCDGQGIAHPRGLGIASHLGLFLDVPTIGCAKSRLIGSYSHRPMKKGESTPLIYKNKTIGAVLCSKDKCRPLFISPGHKISIEDSIEVVLRSLTRFRLPEPTRMAHLASNQKRLEAYLH